MLPERFFLAVPTTCAMSSPKYSSLYLASPASSTERGSRSERREMEGMKGKKRKRSVERRGDQAKETEEAARRSLLLRRKGWFTALGGGVRRWSGRERSPGGLESRKG